MVLLGEGDCFGLGEGEGDGFGLGEGDGFGLGEGDCVGLGEGDGFGLGEGDGFGLGEGDCVVLGEAKGDLDEGLGDLFLFVIILYIISAFSFLACSLRLTCLSSGIKKWVAYHIIIKNKK